MIHPTAIIDPTARLHDSVKVGPYSVIGANVEIGVDTEIFNHASIGCNTKIGARNKIYPYASVGGDPQDYTFQGEDSFLEIGDDNIFREFCTINRGCKKGGNYTRIGHSNWFLSYVHVAHDCNIGNHTLFLNNASLAGHVTVHDFAILGAFVAVHQFCHIGEYTFICRAAQVPQDVPPYMLVKGPNQRPTGINLIGLRRNNFDRSSIRAIQEAYQILYEQDISFQEAEKALGVLAAEAKEVQLIIDFLKKSERGIARVR